MKAIIFEKYKIINLLIVVILVALLAFMNINYSMWFTDDIDIYYLLEYREGIYRPFFVGGQILLSVISILLLFPSRIFRKWLFYVAPPIILLTYFLVQGISVYSSNPLNPTRAKMAENGMTLLAVVTIVFVVVNLVYDWRKKKLSKPA